MPQEDFNQIQASRHMRLIFLCLCLVLASCSGRSSVSPDRIVEFASANSFDSAAHWMDRETILLPNDHIASRNFLIAFPDGMNGYAKPSMYQIALNNTDESKNPKNIYKINMKDTDIQAALGGEVFIVCLDRGDITSLHLVQTPKVIDSVYDASAMGNLGAHKNASDIEFRLWAPTAKSVSVQIYNKNFVPVETIEMTKSHGTGVWVTNSPDVKAEQYYRYEMTLFHPASRKVETYEVTDPYSFSLSANGEFSQIVGLSNPDLAPKNWAEHNRPATGAAPKDIIYRLHVGEFSAFDATQPASSRGKFQAFSNTESQSVGHLASLANSGVTTVNLLPISDFGSVNEIPIERFSFGSTAGEVCDALTLSMEICASDRADLYLSELNSSGAIDDDVQKILSYVTSNDDFSTGVDSQHLFVPDGSYASHADDVSRIIETRQMVQAIHEMGLQVIIDLPIHTGADIGLNIGSVLDKTVPRYFYSRDEATGNIIRGPNGPVMATERKMVQRLISDARRFWTEQYGIDGFNVSQPDQWRNVVTNERSLAEFITTAAPNRTINYMETYENMALRGHLENLDSQSRARDHANFQAMLLLTPGIPLIQAGTEFGNNTKTHNPDYWPFSLSDWKTDTVYEGFKDFIAMRNSSPLFTIDQDGLTQRMKVEPKTSNSDVLVMTLNDQPGRPDQADLDPNYARIITVFNSSNESQKIAIEDAGKLRLHPIHINGSDRVVRRSQIMLDQVVVPARTTAVFVRPQ